MSYEFKNGKLIEAEGPMDFGWENEKTAYFLAGYRPVFTVGPEFGSGRLSVRGRERGAPPIPWPYQFVCSHELGYEYDYHYVYCRGYFELLEYLRYMAPILSMTWFSDAQSDVELEKEEQEKKKERQRKGISAKVAEEQEMKDRITAAKNSEKETEEERPKWEAWLAQNQKAAGNKA